MHLLSICRSMAEIEWSQISSSPMMISTNPASTVAWTTRNRFVHDSKHLVNPLDSKLRWTQCRCKPTIFNACYTKRTPLLQRTPNLFLKVLSYDRAEVASEARKCLWFGHLSIFFHRLWFSSSWRGIVDEVWVFIETTFSFSTDSYVNVNSFLCELHPLDRQLKWNPTMRPCRVDIVVRVHWG